jgi:hypothetical protein
MTVWTRIKLAFAAFFTILFKGRPPVAFQTASHAGAPTQPLAADTSDRAIQMLALLQREGRLVDFVLEDLAAYSDAQIGTAARDVHAGCHRVLERYVTLEAILPGREGEVVTVGQDQQIDPSGTSPGNRRSAARSSTLAGARPAFNFLLSARRIAP